MNLNPVIEQVGRDRGIERAILIETLEAAMKTAAKKVFGEQRDIEAQYNEVKGQVELLLVMIVVENPQNPYREIELYDAHEVDPDTEAGEEIVFQLFYLDEDQKHAERFDEKYGDILNLHTARCSFGRIAAQTAKQVIIQRIREAERENIFQEFQDRKHELINGIVRRFEKGNIIVDLGKTDAILPNREQTRRESYRPGDRIQAYVKDVDKNRRNEQVVLSRTDPGLVIKLFEQEVPEIYEGIVKIVAVAREPGVRSKVAVYSTDRDVDPVGACVGIRGSRVQSVVQELRGEKIDIVPYHVDPARFVCNAISPAMVSKVLVDQARYVMELIVPDDQLSLAIGRAGQNVRLANQLTGWNLEIFSESRLQEVLAVAKQQLLEFEGIDEHHVDTLFQLGYNKLEDISLADPGDIAGAPGFTEEIAGLVIDAASSLLSGGGEDEDEFTEVDLEKQELMKIRGVGEKIAGVIYEAGYIAPRYLAFEDDPERLALLSGIDAKKARQVLNAATKWFEQLVLSDDEREEYEEEREEFLEDIEMIAEEKRAEE